MEMTRLLQHVAVVRIDLSKAVLLGAGQVQRVSRSRGQQYTRTFTDLITVQEEIVTAVSDKLRLRPSADEQRRLVKRYTENPEAQVAYLKGQFEWNDRTGESLLRAAAYFQQAVDKDPEYGLAWAALADTYSIYGFYGVESPRKAAPKAKDAAQRALKIDNTLAEAHTALGFAKFTYDWDWPGAELEYKQAIDLNPEAGLPLQRYAVLLQLMGRTEEAMTVGRRGRDGSRFRSTTTPRSDGCSTTTVNTSRPRAS
jgi:tetratricopeptide (TPR) repeat protein